MLHPFAPAGLYGGRIDASAVEKTLVWDHVLLKPVGVAAREGGLDPEATALDDGTCRVLLRGSGGVPFCPLRKNRMLIIANAWGASER